MQEFRPKRATAQKHRPALSLAWDAARAPTRSLRLETVSTWTLRGIADSQHGMPAKALAEMLAKLPDGQALQFEHEVGISSGAPEYQLRIRLLDSSLNRAGAGSTVSESLKVAAPGLWLEQSDGAGPPENDDSSWPQIACVRPATVRLWSGRERDNNAPDAASTTGAAPYPRPWPTRPLASLLAEGAHQSCGVRIVQRFRSLRLDEEELAPLHATMQRVRVGNLRCFRPHSPLSIYSADAELRQEVAQLMLLWLMQPRGWCLDMSIHAEHDMPEMAVERLARDVFGNMPFEIASGDATNAEPEFARASLPIQGLPAIWPEPNLARELGVAACYPPPQARLPSAGRVIGKTAAGALSADVRIGPQMLMQHAAVIGASGSGKSTLFARSIAEQLADPERSCGIGLIDPHGDLSEQILGMVPQSRIDDVILIDVTDATHSHCINPMQGMRDDPALAHLVASQMIDIMEMLFDTKDSTGPMKRAHLKNLLLMEGMRPAVNGTLLGAVRTLEEPDYRDWLIRNCPDRAVAQYWRRLMATSGDSGYQNFLPYLQAPLVPFTANPVLKRLLGRPDSTLSLSDAMDQRRIVICNLSKSVLQDAECRATGALLLAMFHRAAVARSHKPAAQRAPFILYVDEFPSFAGDSVGRMFAESRKFGLGLCVSMQHADQLANRWGRERLLDAVLANTATKFLFRLGPTDAEQLSPYYQPMLSQREIMRLPDFHSVTTMTHGGKAVPPFVMTVRMPEPPMDAARAEAVRQAAQASATSLGQANSELMKIYDLAAGALGK